jgi:hypothetical protein
MGERLKTAMTDVAETARNVAHVPATRSGVQREFEGKVLPLIGAVPNGTADYCSGGDRTEEPKVTQSAERGQSPYGERSERSERSDAQGIGGVR